MPHTFNYAVKITQANASVQYSNAVKVMSIVATIIAVAFACITYGIIQAAKGIESGLNIFLLPILLVSILGTVG